MQKYTNTWNVSKETVLQNDKHFLTMVGYYPSHEELPPAHNHIFTQIEFVVGGNCKQILNGNKIECTDGTILLMLTQDVHQYTEFSGNVALYNLCFADDMLSREVLDIMYSKNGALLAILEGEVYDRIYMCFKKLLHENKNPDNLSSQIIRGCITEIVIEILRQAQNTNTKIGNSALRKALSYIRENFKHHLTLEDLAAKIHLTPQYFCKLFKQEIGISFHEYLRNMRLDYAMMLIKTTDMNITEICIESGFNSASNFTKIFKARFGFTPKEIKRSK